MSKFSSVVHKWKTLLPLYSLFVIPSSRFAGPHWSWCAVLWPPYCWSAVPASWTGWCLEVPPWLAFRAEVRRAAGKAGRLVVPGMSSKGHSSKISKPRENPKSFLKDLESFFGPMPMAARSLSACAHAGKTWRSPKRDAGSRGAKPQG